MFKGIGGTLVVAVLMFSGVSFAQEEHQPQNDEALKSKIIEMAEEHGVATEENMGALIETLNEQSTYVNAGSICGVLCNPCDAVNAMDLDGDGFISREEMVDEDVMEYAMHKYYKDVSFDDDAFEDDDFDEVEDD